MRQAATLVDVEQRTSDASVQCARSQAVLRQYLTVASSTHPETQGTVVSWDDWSRVDDLGTVRSYYFHGTRAEEGYDHRP